MFGWVRLWFRVIRAYPQISPISTIFFVEASNYAIYNLTLMLIYLINIDRMIDYPNAKWFGFDSKHNMLD